MHMYIHIYAGVRRGDQRGEVDQQRGGDCLLLAAARGDCLLLAILGGCAVQCLACSV